MSRRTRTPLLIMKEEAFPLRGMQVRGTWDPQPGALAPADSDAASLLRRAYRTPPAVIAAGDRELPEIGETIRHESAHAMLQGTMDRAAPAEEQKNWSKGILSRLSQPSVDYVSRIANSGKLVSGFSGDPRAILHESVAYATQQNTLEAVRFLSEVGKKVDINNVMKAAAPGVGENTKMMMSFDDILGIIGGEGKR